MPYKCPIARKENAKKKYEKYKNDPEKVARRKAYAKTYKKGCPIEKQRKDEYNKAFYQKNKEREKKRALEFYEANKERSSAKNAMWMEKNSDKRKAYTKAYRATPEAKAMRCAIQRNRDAQQIKASPPWLNQEHLAEIKEMYLLAKELQWLFEGEVVHVDHIVPLKGKDVCGLHVPWNLQLLGASANISKSNKLIP